MQQKIRNKNNFIEQDGAFSMQNELFFKECHREFSDPRGVPE
jgi:hypothetical protein